MLFYLRDFAYDCLAYSSSQIVNDFCNNLLITDVLGRNTLFFLLWMITQRLKKNDHLWLQKRFGPVKYSYKIHLVFVG